MPEQAMKGAVPSEEVSSRMGRGLNMEKRLLVKGDGRYIIFYTFAGEREAEPGRGEAKPCRS